VNVPATPPPLRPIDGPMSTAMSMLRVLTHRPGRPGPGTVAPAHGVEMAAWPVDAALLQSYRDVVTSAAAVPLLFPALIGTRLQRDLLGLGRLPVNGMGLVHVGSTIEVVGRLPTSGTWHVGAWADGTRHTRSGLEIDLWARCRTDEASWTARMVVLAKSTRAAGDEESGVPQVAADGPWDTEQTLEVPVDAGWSYARVSGDYNPIHLNLVTAKPFGFERAIAHGWWTLAHALAVLGLDEAPATGQRTVEVAYRRPVLLPSQPRLVSRDDATVALLRADDAVHLAARLS
jgi:acyl dehydratase